MTTTDLTTTDAVIVGVPMMDATEARSGALSPLMQSIARNYLAVRARAGEAILDSARYLAEARQAAKYGEWSIFLEATGTPEDTATRLLAIASRADADQQYALAVRDGRLAFTAAFELLSAPEATQRAALESTAPTPATVIRKAKQETKLRTSAELPPLPSEDEQHRETIEYLLKEAEDKGERTGTRLYQQAYDHAREIHDLALHNRMIALIDRATDEPAPPPPAPAGWACEQCGVIVTDMRRPMNPICSTCIIQRQADRVLRPASPTVAAYEAQERADREILAEATGMLSAARALLSSVSVAQRACAVLDRAIAREQAHAFELTQLDRLTRFSATAMISQATFKESLGHIHTLLEATE